MNKIISTILILILSGVPLSYGAECFDHSVWDKIVAANVDQEGYIDYNGIRVNKGGGNFYEYLTYIEIAKIENCTENEKLAFWINAYNLMVVRHILDHAHVEILQPSDAFFKKRIDVASKRISLNSIKNRILRSDADKGGPLPGLSIKKGDPRIHFALVDGIRGAPNLMREAYTGENVKEQLKLAATEFVNDRRFVRIEDDQLVLSDIFKTYAKDFKAVSGVPAFIVQLTDPVIRSDEKEIDQKLLKDYPEKVLFQTDNTVNSLENKEK